MKAKILENEISVVFSSRPDVEREFLTIDCPAGWDDVKKLTKKVLEFDGRRFAFSGWNSDTLKCYFARPIGGSVQTATIKSK